MNYHMTVSAAEKNMWNNKSEFSGKWESLENRPAFATVATTGNYKDLSETPIIPILLRDLVPDEYYMTVSKADKERWDMGSSTVEGKAPLLHTHKKEDVTDFTHTHIKTEITDFPEFGGWSDIAQLEIGTSAGVNNGGSMNQFARIDHVHTIDNYAPTQNIGTKNQTIVNTEMLHSVLIAGFGNVNTATTESGDIVSGGYDDDYRKYKLNIRKDIILQGKPKLETPLDMEDNSLAGNNYLATTKYVNEMKVVPDWNTNIANKPEFYSTSIGSAEVLANQIYNHNSHSDTKINDSNLISSKKLIDILKAIEDIFVPKGTVIMWTGTKESIPCGWEHFPEMNGRVPVGVGDPTDPFVHASDNFQTYKYVGRRGGDVSVKLSPDQLPSHTHNTYIPYGSHGSGAGGSNTNFLKPSGGGNDYYATSTPTGSDEVHENRPPYYALYFIVKTSTCLIDMGNTRVIDDWKDGRDAGTPNKEGQWPAPKNMWGHYKSENGTVDNIEKK